MRQNTAEPRRLVRNWVASKIVGGYRRKLSCAIGGAMPDDVADPQVDECRLVGDTDVLDLGWIEEVAQTPDNELRAHRTAMTYSRVALHLDHLIRGAESTRDCIVPQPAVTPIQKIIYGSASFDRLTSPVPVNANFFNFATWGALAVTQNIGTERAPQRLNVGWASILRRTLTPAVLNVRASDAGIVGRSLAYGSRLIFVSACTALHYFSELIRTENKFVPKLFDTSWNDDKFLRAIAGTKSGELINDERRDRPIRQAFELYGHAREHEPARSRLILGANLTLTCVEQDLVDRPLRQVVDLVPRRLGGALDWRVAKAVARVRGIPPHLSYMLLQSRHEEVRQFLDSAWSRFMTDQVLVMPLPTETLRVGRDVPPRYRAEPYFPNDLSNLDSLRTESDKAIDAATHGALTSVGQLVRSLDRTSGGCRGSAARDWRRWDERMNWAVALMRTRQHDDTLFWRPYSEQDEGRIVAGDYPLRRGDPSALEVRAPSNIRGGGSA